MTHTTNTNANANTNLLRAGFVDYRNSYIVAMRYIIETANTDYKQVPAAPTKDNTGHEAAAIRTAIRAAKKHNERINAAKSIVEKYNIDTTDTSNKALSSYRNTILSDVPYTANIEGRVINVMLKNVPTTAKTLNIDTDNIRIIVEATWIDTIIAAANNNENIHVVFDSLTEAPTVTAGELKKIAAGPIVDVNGNIIPNIEDFLTKWNDGAIMNNLANSDAKAAKDATLEMLKNESK